MKSQYPSLSNNCLENTVESDAENNLLWKLIKPDTIISTSAFSPFFLKIAVTKEPNQISSANVILLKTTASPDLQHYVLNRHWAQELNTPPREREKSISRKNIQFKPL